MAVYLGGSTNVGEDGLSFQQQHQLRALAQLRGDCPLPYYALRLLDKGGGKQGTRQWQRTRHALGLFLFMTLRLMEAFVVYQGFPHNPTTNSEMGVLR
jgi:hypothetical protein